MARPKGSKNANNKAKVELSEVNNSELEVIHAPLTPLSVDFTNEGLNNMAKKINEIITILNYGK